MVPAEEEPAIETITDGYFEKEYYTTTEDISEFLIDLGEQFKNDDKLTITGENWELPFLFSELVKLGIEFEGDREPELEIEVELSGLVEDETPDLV